MARSTTALLAFAAPLASALVNPPHASRTAKAADVLGLLSEQVPKPTEAAVWQYGYEPKNALFARQATLTCGYFDGNSASPNLCGTSSQCNFYSEIGYFACCGLESSCNPVNTCLTYSSGNYGEAFITGDAVQCGSELPQCQTTYFPSVGGLAATGPYTHFDCVSSASPAQYLYQETTSIVTPPSSSSAGGSNSDSVGYTVTVTGPTVSVIVPEPSSATAPSSTATTLPATGSAGIINSGEVGPSSMTSTQGGAAAPAHQTAGAGLLALALAAGQVLL